MIHIPHPLRTLKAFTLLLMLSLHVTVSAAAAQTVNVKLSLNNNPTVAQVIEELHRQTGYEFSYDAGLLAGKLTAVTVDAENEQMETLLTRIFRDTGISFRIKNNRVFLKNETPSETPSEAPQLETSLQQPAARKITGTVKDDNGDPVIGATIIEQGNPSGGTVTDLDGNFTLNLSAPDATLEISYVGYRSQTLSTAGRSVLDITLLEDTQTLDEVVVTALGIRREAKSLTYNVQEIKSSEVTLVKDASFINSLAGKVAGVQINSSASGVGGSTRVVMRGNKSLTGNNNALYVIDGIPMPGLKTHQPESTYENGADEGDFDGISNINPDDIESLSVLTGAAAAALYGSQGANGVVLITTRRGSEGKLKLTYSNSTSFMNPFVMPKFQHTYGQAMTGESPDSWGSRLETPSGYRPRDFFRTGTSVGNGLSFSFGTAKNQTYGSFSALNARGIIPTNDYDRYNFSIRNSTELIDSKLFLDLSAFYMKQKDVNAKTQGRYHNPLLPVYLFPPGDDMDKYKVYKRYNAERGFSTQFWQYGGGDENMQNPYWIVNEEKFINKRDRYMFNMTLKYDILDWMTLTGRAKIDNLEGTAERKLGASTIELFASPFGNYLHNSYNSRNSYADVILNVDKRFDRFGVTANLGASLQDTRYELTGYEGHLTVANHFHYSGIANTGTEYGGSTKATQDKYHDQLQAGFGTVQLNYNSLLFLDLTGRVDWPSSLTFSRKKHFFYPSVGLTGVFSDMVDLSPAKISFLKGRISYSEVGNYPERFIGKTSYRVENGTVNLLSYPSAPYLKPERTRSFETGINMKLFDAKLDLDFTYYKSNTYNQLFRQNLSSTTGYSYQYVNAGNVENKGIELALGYRQKIGQVNWHTNLTYTLNRNRIVELIPEGTPDPRTGEPMQEENRMEVGSRTPEGYQMILTKGGSIGDIYVTGLQTDHQGYIKVDPYTGVVSSDKQTLLYAGNASPKYNLGFRNSFSWKGFNLSLLLDARVGGVVVSATEMIMGKYGVSQASAKAREEGGVPINGKPVNAENYYKEVGHATLAPFVYSATNVRLREMALSYTLPAGWLDNRLEAVELSLTGRNLLMIYNRAPFDPELTASTGTYFQGYDYFMQPSLRSLGFGLKVIF
jgi:TonB-linked SusC/RagA family outer membrane protein